MACFSVHAAVIAINEAIDHQVPADTLTAMKNPNAMLINLDDQLASTYQATLYRAKQDKMENAKNRVAHFFQSICMHCYFVLECELWGIRQMLKSCMCSLRWIYSSWHSVMFPSNLSSYRKQAVISCFSLFSCLKYGPHRYTIPVSVFMLGMHPSVFIDMFSNNEMMSRTD